MKVDDLTVDVTEGEKSVNLRGTNPFSRVDQLAPQLLAAHSVKALVPGVLDDLLQPGDAWHGHVVSVKQYLGGESIPVLGAVEEAAEEHLEVPVAAAPALVPVAAGVVIHLAGHRQARVVAPPRDDPSHVPRGAAHIVHAALLALSHQVLALVIIHHRKFAGDNSLAKTVDTLLYIVTLLIHPVLGLKTSELRLLLPPPGLTLLLLQIARQALVSGGGGSGAWGAEVRLHVRLKGGRGGPVALTTHWTDWTRVYILVAMMIVRRSHNVSMGGVHMSLQ